MRNVICSLHACIPENDSFSNSLELYEEDGRVLLEVAGTTPAGGMDGDPTPVRRVLRTYSFEGSEREGNFILGYILSLCADEKFLFKKHGKPKRFLRWHYRPQTEGTFSSTMGSKRETVLHALGTWDIA